MNHLPLIELSIISQEFSFVVKSRTREFGGLALTANKWPKKSSAENHREMLQRQQQKGNQQQCLNDSKKNLSLISLFFFKAQASLEVQITVIL